jgi:hypothetical protein
MLFGHYCPRSGDRRKIGVSVKSSLFCFLFLLPLLCAAADPTFDVGPPAYAVATQPLVLRADNGSLVLRNRGIAVTKDVYPDGATVTSDWAWLEGVPEMKYQDHLCVAVLTDGKQRTKWSHEIQKGVVVRFNPGSGGIGIEGWLADKDESELFAFKDGFTFEKKTKYAISVEYSKAEITVSVDGKAVVDAKIPEKYRGGGDKVAFYNRESVAGVPHASKLEKIEIVKK